VTFESYKEAFETSAAHAIISGKPVLASVCHTAFNGMGEICRVQGMMFLLVFTFRLARTLATVSSRCLKDMLMFYLPTRAHKDVQQRPATLCRTCLRQPSSELLIINRNVSVSNDRFALDIKLPSLMCNRYFHDSNELFIFDLLTICVKLSLQTRSQGI